MSRLYFHREGRICGLRVRIGFRGKLILQCRRSRETAEASFKLDWKPYIPSEWRDADGRSAEEVAEIVELLRKDEAA